MKHITTRFRSRPISFSEMHLGTIVAITIAKLIIAHVLGGGTSSIHI